MLTPILIKFDNIINPPSLILTSEVEPIIRYYIEIEKPALYPLNPIESKASVAIKSNDSGLILRLSMAPSIGIGSTACYKINYKKYIKYEDYKSTTEDLGSELWYIPNADGTTNPSYIAYKSKLVADYPIPPYKTKTILVESNGAQSVQVPIDVITILSVTDLDGNSYNYNLEDLNTFTTPNPTLTFLETPPPSNFNITYVIPLSLENIFYLDPPTSNQTIFN